jgi:hypothetical protein
MVGMIYIIVIILLCIIVAVYVNKKRVLNNLDADITSGKLRRVDLALNMEEPIDELETIQLVSINNVNSATIKVLGSGNILTTKSNSFFKGGDFGNYGLLLLSVSKEKGEIVLRQTFPA